MFAIIYTYNLNGRIGTEPWLREEITNAEVFRDDYTTVMRDRNARGGGVFICVQKLHLFLGLWADEDFEVLAVEL
jgi:hypothetical protein